MDRDTLLQYFDRHYAPRRGMLPRIPLGMDPDEVWQEIQNRRRAKSTTLPIHNPKGVPYWYVTTGRMISASETLVEELMANEESPLQELSVFTPMPTLAPLEEVFYTSYVEGSSMTMQAAMTFLQSEDEPRDIEEQMIANNRSAMLFAASNLYHPVDEEFIKMLALILTQNMEGGGQEYRTSDWVEIPSMMGERYELPSASSVPNRIKELTAYLADPTVHPLLKASVAQAWTLVARPFPEGNERLARLLSTVILIRSGYTFLGEVSQSAMIAKNGYPYYDAVANILRTEHDGDLTYFMEYFLILLGQAVYERRNRKNETEEENLAAGIAMARTALVSAGSGGAAEPNESESSDTESDEPETIELTEPAHDSVAESLAADGFVSFFTPEYEGEDQPQAGGESRWSGENNARAKIQTIIEDLDDQSTQLVRQMISYLDTGKYCFTAAELMSVTGVPPEQICTLLKHLRNEGVIEQISQKNTDRTYIFCCGILSEADYTERITTLLHELIYESRSAKDRRIGRMILQQLKHGYITIQDYEEFGDETRWTDDMKLAEQMGLVTRITKERCLILRDAQPCFHRLDTGQKRRVRQMYEIFGEEAFSLEMVVATLEYGSSTASAYLHQFTLLRILDCKKEDVNMYQFLVNPEEHPEIFNDVA